METLQLYFQGQKSWLAARKPYREQGKGPVIAEFRCRLEE